VATPKPKTSKTKAVANPFLNPEYKANFASPSVPATIDVPVRKGPEDALSTEPTKLDYSNQFPDDYRPHQGTTAQAPAKPAA
jgi:hypothetical protein